MNAGERFNCTAGEALAVANLVAIKTSDGKCYKADSDSSSLRPVAGWIVADYTSGATVTVVTQGILKGFTALTPGGAVYIGNAGAYSQTPDTYVQIVGWAISATEVRISIQSGA